jgi:hypothetical protein
MRKCRGLCLRSTATQTPEGAALASQRDTSGSMTSYPSSLTEDGPMMNGAGRPPGGTATTCEKGSLRLGNAVCIPGRVCICAHLIRNRLTHRQTGCNCLSPSEVHDFQIRHEHASMECLLATSTYSFRGKENWKCLTQPHPQIRNATFLPLPSRQGHPVAVLVKENPPAKGRWRAYIACHLKNRCLTQPDRQERSEKRWILSLPQSGWV